jgi:hypothetical protein
MIPLTVKIDDHVDFQVARGGFPEHGIAMPTLREVTLEAVAFDPRVGTAVSYTGRFVGPVTLQVQTSPDRKMIEQSCRELAEFLGWTITEEAS